MSTTVPTWNDNPSTLVAPRILKNNVYRTTLDLTGVVGADVVLCAGLNAATALGASEACYIRVRKMFNNKTQSFRGLNYVAYFNGTSAPTTALMITSTQATATQFQMATAACSSLGTLGNVRLLLAGHTGVVWSNMTDGDATSYTAAEFSMLAMAQAATSTNRPAFTNTNYSYGIFLDAPTKNARIASELVVNKAEIIGPLWLENGFYEIIWDAANIQANVAITIAAYHRLYTVDTTT